MDKKDQHEKPGELHSKAPPNNLPPIWENISSALGADESLSTESDDLDLVEEQEHETDVADFSVIKAGFVATFGQQEPPKFLWDTIEQDLEAHVETDSPTEFSTIKDSFLTTYGEHQPPQSFWKELSERVDQPEEEALVEEKADYSRIKKSFERKYSALVVPLFSWDDLAERMDQEAAIADTPDRYSVIKDSFEAVYASEEPSAAVAKGLWERMYPLALLWRVLQKTAYSPRIRGSVAALLLVLGIGMVDTTLSTFSDDSLLGDQGTEQEYSLSNPINSRNISASIPASEGGIEKEENTSSTAANSPVQKNKSQVQEKTPTLSTSTLARAIKQKNQDALVAYNGKKRQRNATASNSTLAQNSLVEASTTGATTTVTAAASQKRTKHNSNTLLIDKTTAANPSNQLANAQNGNGGNTTEIDYTHTKEETNGTVPINNLSELAIGEDQLAVPVLPAAKIALVEEEESKLSSNYIPNPAIAWMERNAFREVRPAIRGKKIHFELGVEGRLGTSLLLQKTGIEQEERDMQLCPTGAVGVNFQYYFGMNDAIVVGAHPYATAIQCWDDKSSSNGTYKEMAMSLSFMDLNVGYQRILFHYNTSATDALASVYARVDLGVGWLMNADTRVNQRSIHAPNLYRNFNWTAGLSIGNLHRIQRFVLDYGLMGNIGLNKLVTSAQPDVLQSARLVNLGGYVGLRYMFTPRQTPSKKQRQFDWSPPFYIEEPKF
ncbi:MAG: hypothetical protein AB8E82_15210 [Aureispira sp.]